MLTRNLLEELGIPGQVQLETKDGFRHFILAFPMEDGDVTEDIDEDDPILAADRDRLEQVVLARSDGTWVDRVAGSLQETAS